MKQQQQLYQQSYWQALIQANLLQQSQNNFNNLGFNQTNSNENELLKQMYLQCQQELTFYKLKDQEILYNPQYNQYIPHSLAMKQQEYQFSQMYQDQQQQYFRVNFAQMQQQQQQQLQLQQQQQQQLQWQQNNLSPLQYNTQQNYINIIPQLQSTLEQQPILQRNNTQIDIQQYSALQNNVCFSSNLQNLTSINQAASPQNLAAYDCQSSNRSTAPLDDNSQQIPFNFYHQASENILSPKTNSPIERQNLKVKITQSVSKKSEEKSEEIRQKSSKQISSLQKSNSLSSDDEDIEAGNELKSNSSPDSASSLNKRTRCLYEPLFRIISPVLPEKKSYKKNIIKYLISYQQGKELQNEKTEKFVAYLEQNNSKQLAKYITQLLQSCKMAQTKKDDKFAHEYIAERICKCFQRKQLKNKAQINKQ